MGIIHVCSCGNYGIIPVILSQMVSKNSGVDAPFQQISNVIPVKCHVHTVIIQMSFFPYIYYLDSVSIDSSSKPNTYKELLRIMFCDMHNNSKMIKFFFL